MTDRLLLTLLGPILLAQGRRVRKKALILPEPVGDREGIRGPRPENSQEEDQARNPDLRLLIVGDSSAAGVGVATQEEALLGHLVRYLAATKRVRFRLVARTGLTTSHILQWLTKMPAEEFDVAVTSLGVNDTTRLREPADFIAQQEALLDLLREKFQVRQTVVTGLPPMHLFPALPQPLRWVMGRRARQLDAALAALAADRPETQHLNTNFAVDPGKMASDGFHPGPTHYRQWAEMVAEILLPPESRPPA
ncbi:lipase [bacterium DOLZORAL124_64_63]|nr:MAG: lipase [bacterium DOLZORAL124_64_63]